jgi:histidinol-phosphate aminotransferase
LNREGMLYVTRAFDNLGLEHIPSIGNFVTVDVGRSGAEVFEALLQKGVIVRPVANYGMLNHLRISIGLAQENHRCLEALSEVLGAK